MKAIGEKYYTEKPIVISAKIVHFTKVCTVLIIGILYAWFHSYINTHGGEFGVFNSFLYYPCNLICILIVALIYALLLKLVKPSYSIDIKLMHNKYIPTIFAFVGVALLLGYRYLIPFLHKTFPDGGYPIISQYILVTIVLILSIAINIIILFTSEWDVLFQITCIGTGLLWSFIGVRLPMRRAEQNPAILNFFKTVSPLLVSCLPLLVFNYRKKLKSKT